MITGCTTCNQTRDNNVMHAKPGLRADFSACKIIVPAR